MHVVHLKCKQYNSGYICMFLPITQLVFNLYLDRLITIFSFLWKNNGCLIPVVRGCKYQNTHWPFRIILTASAKLIKVREARFVSFKTELSNCTRTSHPNYTSTHTNTAVMKVSKSSWKKPAFLEESNFYLQICSRFWVTEFFSFRFLDEYSLSRFNIEKGFV